MAQESKGKLIRKELALIEKEFTYITPEAIVERAKSPDSILHGVFNWDDESAGNQWRLQQARQLMNSYEIKVKGERNVPAYESVIVNISGVKTRGYISSEKIQNSENLRLQVMNDAVNEAKSFLFKYSYYKGLGNIINEEELSKVEEIIKAMRQAMQTV